MIIGAAGFSLPQDIAKRDYVEKVDVCDIDGSLDVIAENIFFMKNSTQKLYFIRNLQDILSMRKSEITRNMILYSLMHTMERYLFHQSFSQRIF